MNNCFTALYRAALEARKNAYAPHSGFYVGAALLTSAGKLYTGCNIENKSYSATICAERAALFAAVSAGEREFTAIAVAGWKWKSEQEKPEAPEEAAPPCLPCGVCRQVMAEFCGPEFKIITSDSVFTLGGLLPHSFEM